MTARVLNPAAGTKNDRVKEGSAAQRHLTGPIMGHALLRIASGTSGILIGLYLASLNSHGSHLSVGLVGTLSAVSFAAELLASIPMGLASDAIEPRWLMTAGALLGAIAVFLFGISSSPPIFFLSRTLEGVGAAAIVPALLAYITTVTEGRAALRVRAMSYFELTLLAGLALGGVVAAQLFRWLHGGAFAAVAVVYLACAALLFLSVSGSISSRVISPIADLKEVLRLPAIRHLAPVWLCVNSVVGLWLGPTLPFLLTQHSTNSQYLAGIYASDPARVGWMLLVYAIVFGIGVTGWSFVLPYIRLHTAMTITPMDHREGFAANLVTAALVGIGAPLGLPMSTTHVASGAILGIAAEQRMPANRKVIVEMMIAWVVTLPASGLLSVVVLMMLNKTTLSGR